MEDLPKFQKAPSLNIVKTNKLNKPYLRCTRKRDSVFDASFVQSWKFSISQLVREPLPISVRFHGRVLPLFLMPGSLCQCQHTGE